MGLIVYLSNTHVQVISGSAKGKNVSIDKVYTMPVPEGSILNGVIMDSAALSQSMKEFWEANKLSKKGLKLIVTNPHVAVRMVDIPFQSKKKSEEYLKREVADEGNDQVVGFYEISSDKKIKQKKLCAEVADKSLILEYSQLFKAAGLGIENINSSTGVTINFLLQEDSVTGKTCIVMNLDGNTITSVFFVKGAYFYSASRRVFNDVGTEGFARDIAATVNQINQFAASQRVEDQIEAIYLSGMGEQDAVNCTYTIKDTLSYDVSIERLNNNSKVNIKDPQYTLNELLYPVAGVVERKNQLNIMEVIDFSEKKESSDKSALIKKLIPYGITIVVMTIVTIVFAVVNSKTSKQLKEYQDYVKNPVNIVQVLDYDEAAAKAGSYGKHYGSLYILNQNINSFPWPNYSVIKTMKKAAEGLADIQISNYDSSTGVIAISATASKEEKVNKFVSRLMEDKAFDNVNYTGYIHNDNGGWTINLTCILSEIAGKSEEELKREEMDKNGVRGGSSTTESEDVSSESSENSEDVSSEAESGSSESDSDSSDENSSSDSGSSSSSSVDSGSSSTAADESGVE